MEVELLTSLASTGYSPWRIPGPRDNDIASLVAKVSSPREYEQLNSRLDLDTARILTAFAARAASWAVRVADQWPVKRGIVAALLATGVEDDREIIIVLSLLFRAAELIDADPVAIFDEAYQAVGKHAIDIARNFSHGDPSSRSISAMGYVESRDDDGFRFRSTW
jgi:hypothetical protein